VLALTLQTTASSRSVATSVFVFIGFPKEEKENFDERMSEVFSKNLRKKASFWRQIDSNDPNRLLIDQYQKKEDSYRRILSLVSMFRRKVVDRTWSTERHRLGIRASNVVCGGNNTRWRRKFFRKIRRSTTISSVKTKSI